MVVKNNYFWVDKKEHPDFEFIANGDVAIVRKLHKVKELYGFRYGLLTLEFPDYNNLILEDCWVLLDTLHSDAPSLTRDQSSRLFYTIKKLSEKLDIFNVLYESNYGKGA